MVRPTRLVFNCREDSRACRGRGSVVQLDLSSLFDNHARHGQSQHCPSLVVIAERLTPMIERLKQAGRRGRRDGAAV